MDIQEFISNLDEVFEETDLTTLSPETNFRNLDEWSSMSVLALIAFADEKFNKEIEASEIRQLSTIQDLYNLFTK